MRERVKAAWRSSSVQTRRWYVMAWAALIVWLPSMFVALNSERPLSLVAGVLWGISMLTFFVLMLLMAFRATRPTHGHGPKDAGPTATTGPEGSAK
ncbi:hypothetical protein ACIGEP_13130 [Microbacterium sp. NPDC077663]|uniref:hypothetical protein n=1 Tax=Microbacterium sp. NPDC077663 TaxID=3364189 RepID=UPI0037CA8AF4